MFSLVLFHSVFLNSTIGIDMRHIADCLCSKCCAERECEEKQKTYAYFICLRLFYKVINFGRQRCDKILDSKI